MKLDGKRALVTGAGHGIGRAIALRLAADGARVLVCDMNAEGAAETVATITAAGGEAAAQSTDVRERAEVDAAVAEAVRRWGRLDIAVANAGIMTRAPFLDLDDALWARVLGTNLYGCFVCGQLAARQMVEQGGGGRIINVASNSGVFGGRGRAAYGASKAGIINLTQTMAIELAEHGILVNAVAPGPTLTDAARQGELMASARARMPLARYGTPAEVAAVVAFLAGDECSFVTGHLYPVDGGFTIAGIMEG